MGFILQTQRRAIEEVITPVEFRYRDSCKYFLCGEPLCFLGISRGVGTCSDRHGLNVAVFGRMPPPVPAPSRRSFDRLSHLCRGAVLLRKPADGDNEPLFTARQMEIAMAVDGLKIIQKSGLEVFFRRNDRSKLYIPV